MHAHEPAGAGPGQGVGGNPPRRLRVLVVDDEESIRLAMRIVLERRGHEVVLAADVPEGRALARADGIDVALVDLRLPGNGLTLLRELDQLPRLAGKTVLVTGSQDLLMDEHGNYVWPRWLTKPFDYDALISLVEQLGG